MSPIRTTLVLALAAATLGCGSSSTTQPPTQTPLPKAGAVDVAISSVTLADDCGSPPTVPPPVSSDASSDAPEREAENRKASSMAGPGQGSQLKPAGDRACEQSSVQLRVANDTDAGATIAIKKVEVLDESGAVIGELTVRDPSQWSADAYRPWDQSVGAKQTVQASYALSQPMVSQGSTYIVRVTVATADGEQTLEQRTTLEMEASLPPGAVT